MRPMAAACTPLIALNYIYVLYIRVVLGDDLLYIIYTRNGFLIGFTSAYNGYLKRTSPTPARLFFVHRIPISLLFDKYNNIILARIECEDSYIR